jgi:hypothetical protein
MKRVSIICTMMLFLFVAACRSDRYSQENPLFRSVSGYTGDLQQLLNDTPAFSTLNFNPSDEYLLKKTLYIDKPLTIKGFSARIPAGRAANMLVVREAGVTIDNMKLTGNAGTVDEEKRKALLSIEKGYFIIENSFFYNSSKDGIEVSNPDSKTIEHGVITNILGRGNLRDLVSINGENDGRIHHLLIEHIRCYNSPYRGAVEVSDGTENITVRKVFADSCVYAIDVQDHGYPYVVNHEILIEDVIARNCRHAIRTANSDIGHTRHIFRDITAVHCQQPIYITNINNVLIDNVSIFGHSGTKDLFRVENCQNVTVSNVVLADVPTGGSGIHFINCDNVFVSNVRLTGNIGLDYGIHYLVNDGRQYKVFTIAHSILEGTRKTGLLLQKENGSTLSNLILDGNVGID